MNKKYLKYKLSILLIILIGNNLFAINFSVYTPSTPHASSTYFQDGFSMEYSYSGFFSSTGQINLYYKNSSRDSYHFGISLPHISFGICKHMKSNKYINVNFIYGLGGSLGVSKLYPSLNHNVEIALDLFYYRGINGGDIVIFEPRPYSRGGVSMINYTKKISYGFRFIAGIGLSYIQYREMYNSKDQDWEYVSYSKENKNYNWLSRSRWKSFLIVPFKLSLSYDF